MTRKRQCLMLFSCVFVAFMAYVESATFAASVKPIRRTIVVPAKTSLDVRLATAVASESDRHEDPVLATLAAPVIVNGVSVAPAASVLLGNVVVAAESERGSSAREIVLRFDRLRVGPTTYDIHTALIRIPHDAPAARFRLELLEPVSIDVQRLR